jgi:hypothetical protein
MAPSAPTEARTNASLRAMPSRQRARADSGKPSSARSTNGVSAWPERGTA